MSALLHELPCVHHPDGPPEGYCASDDCGPCRARECDALLDERDRLRAERDRLRAECALARTLLSEIVPGGERSLDWRNRGTTLVRVWGFLDRWAGPRVER